MAVKRKTFPVQGLGCAACVAHVENALKRLPGVTDVAVSLASNSARVDYDAAAVTPSEIKKAVQDAGYDLVVPEEAEDGDDPDIAAEEEAERRREDAYRALRRDMVLAVGLAVLVMVVGMGFKPFPGRGWVLAALASVSSFWCGRRFFASAWAQARHGTSGMDTLVALSVAISMLFSFFNLLFPQVWTSRSLEPRLYFESASMIVAFILVGRVLEERAKRATTASVRALAGLQPRQVHVEAGETVLVRAGDRIPVDGIVVSGNASVDESMFTGEWEPSEKREGSPVYAGTLNRNGALTVRAEKTGKDTMLSAIVRMVREAQGSKAKIQHTVDKVAAVFVPVIIGISLLAFLGWAILAEDGVARGLLSMVTVLVVACPCALGLATPTALIAGIGKGASEGILIRDADSLEVARKVNAVVFDKTGTLTEGRPEVMDMRIASGAEDEVRREVLPVVLAMEQRSDHPLAEAIVRYLNGTEPAEISDFEALPGVGVRCLSGGHAYTAGRVAAGAAPEGAGLSRETGQPEAPAAEPLRAGRTLVEVRRDGRPAAVFALTDTVRPSSARAVEALKRQGIEVHLLTGDHAAAAEPVARAAGINRVRAGVLPQDKAQYVKDLKQAGKVVAMVGDGINDSAALASADLSVAMGGGSDIAVSTAMVTIVASDPEKLPRLIALSRKTSRIIWENLAWAFLYNLIAVPTATGLFYAAGGFLLNPMTAAAAMAFSSVLVVTNSLRLRR